VEDTKTALADAPDTEVVAAVPAENKPFPVAVAVAVVAAAIFVAGGAFWFLKLRHIVK